MNVKNLNLNSNNIVVLNRSLYPEELTYKLYERRARSRLALGKIQLSIQVSRRGGSLAG